MADVRLLSSDKSYKPLPRASEDSDFSLDVSSAEDYAADTFISTSKFTSKLDSCYQTIADRCSCFHTIRWGIVLIISICFAVICLGVILIVSSSQLEEFHTTLPKLNQEHRNLYCTTWSKKATAEAAKQWKPPQATNSTEYDAGHKSREWKKPQGVKVAALIFYGRREYVDILDCYLQQNLVSQGGYLDEVLFVANAADPRDYKYLDKIVRSTDEYKRIEVPERCDVSISLAGCIWDVVSERDTLYLKIDDDMLWLHPDAIPSLVETRLKQKHAFAIGANVINVVQTGPPHYHNGAIHAYLPEPDVTEVQHDQITWRPSELPDYPSEKAPSLDGRKSVFAMVPPFHGHRWLPLRKSWHDLKKTPMSLLEQSTPKKNHELFKTWSADAQTQYSLLENLETKQLGKYQIGGKDGIWYTQFDRFNINFIAIWGSDIIDNLPFDYHTGIARDERILTQTLPQQLDRPFLVDSRALALHFSFHRQRSVGKTDLLDRWRAYANEKVCYKMKKPFGPRCEGVE